MGGGGEVMPDDRGEGGERRCPMTDGRGGEAMPDDRGEGGGETVADDRWEGGERRCPMKNEILTVVACPRTRDHSAQKTASIQPAVQ